MDSLDALPEATRFLSQLLLGTRKGIVKWDATSDREMKAELGDEYSATIALVPDLDGNSSEPPDHVVSAYFQGKFLFAIDRRTVDSETLAKGLGDEVAYAFRVFDELWRRARLSTSKMTDHINKLNLILDKKLQ